MCCHSCAVFGARPSNVICPSSATRVCDGADRHNCPRERNPLFSGWARQHTSYTNSLSPSTFVSRSDPSSLTESSASSFSSTIWSRMGGIRTSSMPSWLDLPNSSPSRPSNSATCFIVFCARLLSACRSSWYSHRSSASFTLEDPPPPYDRRRSCPCPARWLAAAPARFIRPHSFSIATMHPTMSCRRVNKPFASLLSTMLGNSPFAISSTNSLRRLNLTDNARYSCCSHFSAHGAFAGDDRLFEERIDSHRRASPQFRRRDRSSSTSFSAGGGFFGSTSTSSRKNARDSGCDNTLPPAAVRPPRPPPSDDDEEEEEAEEEEEEEPPPAPPLPPLSDREERGDDMAWAGVVVEGRSSVAEMASASCAIVEEEGTPSNSRCSASMVRPSRRLLGSVEEGGKYLDAHLASFTFSTSSSFWILPHCCSRRVAASRSCPRGAAATWLARYSTAPSSLRKDAVSPDPSDTHSSRIPSGSFARSTSVAGSPFDVTKTRRPRAR